jgi:hypothetical protein
LRGPGDEGFQTATPARRPAIADLPLVVGDVDGHAVGGRSPSRGRCRNSGPSSSKRSPSDPALRRSALASRSSRRRLVRSCFFLPFWTTGRVRGAGPESLAAGLRGRVMTYLVLRVALAAAVSAAGAGPATVQTPAPAIAPAPPAQAPSCDASADAPAPSAGPCETAGSLDTRRYARAVVEGLQPDISVIGNFVGVAARTR